jgi:cytochrome c oxidase subunit III
VSSAGDTRAAPPASAGADDAGHSPLLAHHFDSIVQQRTSVELGMWLFLAQEVMFFGGLFLAYTFYRSRYHEAFVEASHHLDVRLGTINTVVLIGSSLTMALAVRAAQGGKREMTRNLVVLTMALGVVFLGIKAYEYHHKFVEHLIPGTGFVYEGQHPRGAQVFYLLYFVMTGMHALHMIIGEGVMIALLVWNARGGVSAEYPSRVEGVGLYWHFVDIVWIFLFPMLYLIARH